MESLYTALIFLLLLVAVGAPYWLRVKRQRKKSEDARRKNEQSGLLEPVTLHPHIDLLSCIGCGSCVQVCPEDVLGIVNGRASVVHGVRCVGHSLCSEACPVGAITMGFGKPRQGMEIPFYDDHFMTNIPGLYIVGELGGIGLIKNAFEQSKKAVEHLALASHEGNTGETDVDVLIVGAGPAGIAAGLAAQSKGLRHCILEQDELGGSILHYPRQKLVLTSPVELPLYGKLRLSEISKEELLSIIKEIVRRFSLDVREKHKVESITKEKNIFQVKSDARTFRATNVILALGRRGSPKKLGVPGEELPKVFYRLIEAEKYRRKNIIVVGGGDSAVEAVIALSRQKGNTVTLSYRRSSFVRLKEKNEQRIQSLMNEGSVTVAFNSEVIEIRDTSVVLKDSTGLDELPNDFVFIFAGGELPAEFLRGIGVQLREQEA